MVANKARILSAAVIGAGIGIMGTIEVLNYQLISFRSSKVEVYYAPAENLESIDVGLIGSARQSIDMAVYILTDGAIFAALNQAYGRGVKIRIAKECSQSPAHFYSLVDDPKWQVFEVCHHDLMHLKSYAIDGKLLRTGSANFSYSGLLKQNNDLVIIRDKKAVDAFEEQFREMMR